MVNFIKSDFKIKTNFDGMQVSNVGSDLELQTDVSFLVVWYLEWYLKKKSLLTFRTS